MNSHPLPSDKRENGSDENFKFCNVLNIPEPQFIHDLALLRLSKSESLPEDNYNLLVQYNDCVADLIEFYNQYEFGKKS